MRFGDLIAALDAAGLGVSAMLRAEHSPQKPELRFQIRDIPGFRNSSVNVLNRLERLNPNGVSEGSYPRGWHPHHRMDHRMRMSMAPREFVRRFGRAAYDALGRGDIIRRGHRKGVALRAVAQLAVR